MALEQVGNGNTDALTDLCSGLPHRMHALNEEELKMDTFEIVDGYDKKTVHIVRRFTLDDIRSLATGWGEYHFIDRHNQLRRCRKNGGLKTWKREPERFEQSFKYGMYESFRLTTEQMLNDLVVIVKTKES